MQAVRLLAVPRDFTRHDLSASHSISAGALPEGLRLGHEGFAELWNLHPSRFGEIRMHGRVVSTPRWQQAYGMDYAFSGRRSRALPLFPYLNDLMTWAREISPGVNGALVNWYDGSLGHYIGPHRDAVGDLVDPAPIIMVSFGESRTLRLRPWRMKGKVDFSADDGSVFILPYNTNRCWTHEIPKTKKARGRRISVTLRSFRSG